MSQNSPATARTPAEAPSARPKWQTPARARKRPRHLEDDLQATCVRWFRLQYAPLAGLLFAIPNGGQRNPREGARLKAQGVTAGVPDLLLAKPRYDANGHARSAGLWLELKVGKNKPSEEQKKMLALLVEHGYATAVVYSFEEFQAAITTYLGY